MAGRGADFGGRTAMVTGAAGGIGRAVVELFLERGARVVALDRDIASLPAGALALSCDILDPAQIRAAAERAGEVDILANVAGAENTASAVDVTAADWARVIGVNLTGALEVSRAVLPGMAARGRGAIVNVSSISGLIGWPLSAAYCAAKGGVIQLTRQMAVDFGPQGVRVNAVCPGTTLTPMIERLFDDMPADARAEVQDRHPLNRFAAPREIAQAICWLASDRASFVSGAILPVDGGYTAK